MYIQRDPAAKEARAGCRCGGKERALTDAARDEHAAGRQEDLVVRVSVEGHGGPHRPAVCCGVVDLGRVDADELRADGVVEAGRRWGCDGVAANAARHQHLAAGEQGGPLQVSFQLHGRCAREAGRGRGEDLDGADGLGERALAAGDQHAAVQERRHL